VNFAIEFLIARRAIIFLNSGLLASFMNKLTSQHIPPHKKT
jgi:hypothetical protein